MQVVVAVVVLDVERSCSKGEQRDEKGASRGTRKREGRRRKRKGKGKKKKKGTSAQTRMTLEGQGIVQWWVHEKRAQRRRGELLPDACC